MCTQAQPEALDKIFASEGLGGLRDCHFCLVGCDAEGEGLKIAPDAATQRLLKRFLKHGFQHLSFCIGGFRACHQQAIQVGRAAPATAPVCISVPFAFCADLCCE